MVLVVGRKDLLQWGNFWLKTLLLNPWCFSLYEVLFYTQWAWRAPELSPEQSHPLSNPPHSSAGSQRDLLELNSGSVCFLDFWSHWLWCCCPDRWHRPCSTKEPKLPQVWHLVGFRGTSSELHAQDSYLLLLSVESLLPICTALHLADAFIRSISQQRKFNQATVTVNYIVSAVKNLAQGCWSPEPAPASTSPKKHDATSVSYQR